MTRTQTHCFFDVCLSHFSQTSCSNVQYAIFIQWQVPCKSLLQIHKSLANARDAVAVSHLVMNFHCLISYTRKCHMSIRDAGFTGGWHHVMSVALCSLQPRSLTGSKVSYVYVWVTVATLICDNLWLYI